MRHPYVLDRNPCGSSSGSAVAVAVPENTAGPMARTVADIATVLAAYDPCDPVTTENAGRADEDYRAFLDVNGLEGARLGVARDYFGYHEGTDAVIEQAIRTLAGLGGCASPPATAGYRHTTVPAGYVHGFPIGLSFFAGAYQEGNLIRYAYAFEQATRTRRPPRFLATIQA